MIAPTPLRIVGIGSPHGDDAIGWQVVAELERALPARTGFEYHRVDGGQRLLDLLDGAGSLILIDALAGDDVPGTMLRFVWPEECVESLRPGSTHDLGPAAALKLAECLGTAPAMILVYGIAAAGFHPGESLSPELVRAIPEIVNKLRFDLESLIAGMEQSCTKPLC